MRPEPSLNRLHHVRRARRRALIQSISTSQPEAKLKHLKQHLVAVATFLVRPSIFLIVGLGGGYFIGFSDAFRDYDTLGDKVSRVVYRIHPEALSQGVRSRAAVLRDTVQARTGADIPRD